MAAAQTLTVDSTVDVRSGGTDATVSPASAGIKPTVAGGQAFDLTLYPNLRAVQIHAVNGAQPITYWTLTDPNNGPASIAADTPDGWCEEGVTAAALTEVLAAQFFGATLSSTYGTIAPYSASALAAPAASYALNTSFWIGDGALKDYFANNWGDITVGCAASSTPEQPADTDQRQTLYVPAGAQALAFGVVDNFYPDNTGSAVVSLMLTISDDSGAAPIGGGTALNVIDNDTINGSTPAIGTSTASISQSTVDPQGNAVPWPAGVTLDTTTGNIQVAPTATPGTYPVWYQLCDNTTSPASCALALATVTVRAAPSAQSVPTLGEMALALLAALLGLTAVFARRRRS